MSGLRSEDGLVHVASDAPRGLSSSRQYAYCDIVKYVAHDSFPRYVPIRNWSFKEILDEVPTCLACIGAVQWSIGAV